MEDATQRSLRVFLCHTSADKPIVRALYKRLVVDGFDAWLDQEKLLPGQKWQFEIPKAVRSSDVVIVCISKNSINKEGYVQKEIKFALDIADEKPEGTIFIIPLRLDECSVPDRISQWQWVDWFENNSYEKLIKALKIRASDLKNLNIKKYQVPIKEIDLSLPDGSKHPTITGNKLNQKKVVDIRNSLSKNVFIGLVSILLILTIAIYATTVYINSTQGITATAIANETGTAYANFVATLASPTMTPILPTIPPTITPTPYLLFSPNISTSNSPDTIRIETADDIDKLATIKLPFESKYFGFSTFFEKQPLVSISSDGTIHLWDSVNGDLLKSFSQDIEDPNYTESITLSDNNKLLAETYKTTIKLWDIQSGNLIYTLREHTNAVTSLKFVPNTNLLLSGSTDGTVRVWDAENGRLLQTVLEDDSFYFDLKNKIIISHDGKTVFSMFNRDSGVHFYLYQLENSTLKRYYQDEWYGTTIDDVVFSPDDTIIAICEGNSIFFRRTRDGYHMNKTFDIECNKIAYSPDGSIIAVALSNRINLLNAENGSYLATLVDDTENTYGSLSISDIAYSPDGTMLAEKFGNFLNIWGVTP